MALINKQYLNFHYKNTVVYVDFLKDYAAMLYNRDKNKNAQQYALQGKRIAEQINDTNKHEYACILCLLGDINIDKKNYKQSASYFKGAVDIFDNVSPTSDSDRVHCTNRYHSALKYLNNGS